MVSVVSFITAGSIEDQAPLGGSINTLLKVPHWNLLTSPVRGGSYFTDIIYALTGKGAPYVNNFNDFPFNNIEWTSKVAEDGNA